VAVTVNKRVRPKRPDGGMLEHGMTNDRPVALAYFCRSYPTEWETTATSPRLTVPPVPGLRPEPAHGPAGGTQLPEAMRVLWAVCIVAREVKFLDRPEATRSEGVGQVHACQSRTRVWGTKMIRYRCSPLAVNGASSALVCVLPLERRHRRPLPHNEKSKPVGSGGSTFARRKLKGIDGMTPQGVESAA